MNDEKKLLNVIAKVSGVEASHIRPDMDLVADLGMDSVKAMELLIELEDQLGIELAEEAQDGLTTVSALVDLIKTLQSRAHTS